MCGICGVINFTDVQVDSTVLDNMTRSMIHRGPDGEGRYIHEKVGFGFRRLSIVDVEEGNQPLSNENGTVWMVCNGEIYNYKTLRNELESRGHCFRTQSDVEVIIHLYEEKGIACVSELKGMFAFALYDEESDTLYLARDPFGIKPLFYRRLSNQLLFASDIRSILMGDPVAKRVNPHSLWHYLTFQYVPKNQTMLDGVQSIPPATIAKIQADGMVLTKYWEMRFKPDESRSFEEHVDATRNVLTASVTRHLTGDVPIGAFLSSGIDSTSIVALMRRHSHLKTFSVGFEGADTIYDELLISSQIARELDVENEQIVITPEQYIHSLPNVVWAQETPVADPSAVGLFFVSQLASQHCKVVLSGEGADELFGGYPIYHEPLSLQAFDYLSPSLRGSLGKLAKRLPVGLKGRGFLERGSLPLERRFLGNANIFTNDFKRELLQSEWHSYECDPYKVVKPLYRSSVELDDITRMQYVDMNTWLVGDILAKADKMSMTHALEVRVPFLDKDVFEVASTIPWYERIKGKHTKYVLRKAVDGIVPKQSTYRPKLGFPVPLREWLKGPLQSFMTDTLTSDVSHSYFRKELVEKLMKDHVKGYRDHTRQLWTLITFLIWHQLYIEN